MNRIRRSPGAHGDRGLDELALAEAEHLAAHDAGEVRPAEDAHHEDQVEDPRRVALRHPQLGQPLGEHAGQRQDDQEEREGEDQVHEAAEEGVGPAARRSRR